MPITTQSDKIHLRSDQEVPSMSEPEYTPGDPIFYY